MTEVLWNRMTAEELRQKAADDAIVLLPVASTEQHTFETCRDVRYSVAISGKRT